MVTSAKPPLGGTVIAPQQGAAPLSVFAAPATGDEFNTLGERLVPKGCFKIEDLLFDFDSSFVRPDIEQDMPRLAQLRSDNKVKDPQSGTDLLPPLSIFGHADPVGDDDHNKQLSGRRAMAIYGMLVRDVDLWEKLFTPAVGKDDWGTRAIQTMLSRVQSPIAINGTNSGATRDAVREFQTAQGLKVDGNAGPVTRKVLYRAYMDALCGPALELDKVKDFLGRNADPGGKADFQGCSEFNPLLLFSKAEAASFAAATDKTERNQENAPNRRVMILLFAAGRRVKPAAWPCPRATEGVAACKKRFFPDAEKRRSFQAERRAFEDTKDTFACRFYQIISDDSPCERVKPAPLPIPPPPPPPPIIESVGPLIDEVREPTTQSPIALADARADSRAFLSRLAPAARAGVVGDSPSVLGPGFGFVMVRKDTSVPRQAFRLRVDSTFDGKGTLTIAPAGKINFFKPGGDGTTPMNFVTDNDFDGAALSTAEGVVIFGEGVTPSLNKDDITLTLTLSGGTKLLKPPATMKLTVVDLTLDIAPPPVPKQAPVPLPVPDKRTKGVKVSVQDDPPHARRAVLIVRPPKPADINQDLLLHTLSGRVDAFDEEVAAKDQKPKSGAIEIKSNSIPATGLQFFVQGKVPSNKDADETYSLGINTGALGTLRVDTVALTVVPQLTVHLKLVFLDPTAPAQEHVFPEGFPVAVDEATATDLKVGKNGVLTFNVERQLQTTFTLKFKSDSDQYFASAPAGAAGDPEKLATTAEVANLVTNGHRVFLLPRAWSLLESDWTPDDATNFDAPNARFTGVEDTAKTFGTEAKPIKLTLNPHWQYLRFEYFDRFFGDSDHSHNRIGIPPIMLEGLRQVPAGAAAATVDTRSNWIVNGTDTAKSCQCLPWIVQRKPDKTADAKPDTKVLVQFRAAANTFIKATNATTRSIVTTGAAPAAADPGLNAGTAAADDPTKPNADRLKLYDLPAIWKSTKYFTRIPGGPDDFFDKLTLAQMQASANKDPTKMLTFSLDDIVLMVPSGASLTPLALKAGDRAAIFCHTFSQRKPSSTADDPNLTREGVYKPDPPTPHFSKNVKHLDTQTNYISDYPDWTRLVIAQGNLFDLFDRRTPDSPTVVVGARAAVRIVDATTGANFAPPRATVTGSASIVHPNPVKTNFLTVHPFYEQHNRRGSDAASAQEEGTGRFDLALIRCCGIDAADATKEVAIALNYFRFFFQPNPTISAANGNVGQAPSGLAGAALANYVKSCIRNVPQRWNGPDPDATADVANPPGAAGAPVGPVYGVSTVTGVPNPSNCNPGRMQIEPQSPSPKLRVDVMWFAQAFQDAKIAHFVMDIYANCRAFMASSIGFGQVSATDNTPFLADAGFPVGSFTFAHENGHGGSLADEYAENSFSASYFQDGIYYSTPGSPYIRDRNVLMCQNMTNVTPRYGWHIAEWLRFLDNNTGDFQVKHRGFTFKLPHLNVASYQTNVAGAKPSTAAKSFLYTHVNWPTDEHAVASIGTRGKCTLFLYKLGDENFNQQIVAPGKGTMDGLLVVAVKIKFTCPTLASFRDIRDAMALINSNIDRAYNVTRVFATSGSANGVTYTQIRIRFVPRFLVTDYRDQANPALTPPTLNQYADALGFTGAAATFPAQYAQRVRDIETLHGTDFQVTTQAGPSAFVGATRQLNFQLVAPLPATISFDSFFAEMLGVVPANRFTPASYNPLVQQVIPGASVVLVP